MFEIVQSHQLRYGKKKLTKNFGIKSKKLKQIGSKIISIKNAILNTLIGKNIKADGDLNNIQNDIKIPKLDVARHKKINTNRKQNPIQEINIFEKINKIKKVKDILNKNNKEEDINYDHNKDNDHNKENDSKIEQNYDSDLFEKLKEDFVYDYTDNDSIKNFTANVNDLDEMQFITDEFKYLNDQIQFYDHKSPPKISRLECFDHHSNQSSSFDFGEGFGDKNIFGEEEIFDTINIVSSFNEVEVIENGDNTWTFIIDGMDAELMSNQDGIVKDDKLAFLAAAEGIFKMSDGSTLNFNNIRVITWKN